MKERKIGPFRWPERLLGRTGKTRLDDGSRVGATHFHAIWPLSSGYSAGVESGPLQQLGQLGDVGGDAPGLLGQPLRFEGMI